MVPVIALVGRPNVGKSTLFNRLTQTRDALVADFAGLTRDRKYGTAEIGQCEYIIIDTGGIDGVDEDSLDQQIAKQTFLAIKEADVVLFMVDAKAGVVSGDYEIASYLRKRKKPTVVVANKVDGLDPDTVVGDFYTLGIGEVYPIAASHGSGLSSLIKRVLLPIYRNDKLLDATDDKYEESQYESSVDPVDLPIKVAIVGQANVGKSTLINRILGEDRVIVYDMPGTTRDSIDIPMKMNGRDYILIDTAGVRKRAKVTKTVEKFSVVKTLKAIENANVVLLVIDARKGLSDQDLSLLGFVINSGRALLIAINKWDGLPNHTRTEVKSVLEKRLSFVNFVRIHFISALRGSGVRALFKSINEAYDCATKRVNASLLTKVVQMAQSDHQPPLVRGRRIKLKYAHPGGYNPPIVVIHGNQVKALPDSYKRYLAHYYRDALGIMGSPIRIQFKESENPYQDRKNALSVSQLYKRRRLMKHVKKRK